MTIKLLQDYPPTFHRFLAADSLILMSLTIGQVVLPWLIAQHGGARDLATFGFSIALMTFVAMPALSPLGDRLPQQWLIRLGLSLYTVEAVAIALMSSFGVYSITGIILLEMGGVACYSLVSPIMSNVPADILPPTALSKGMALQKGLQSVGRFIGPVLAGLVLASFGTSAALWLHALLLFGAIVFAGRLGLTSEAKPAPAGGRLRQWRRDLARGAKAIWGVPIERYWSLVNFVSWLFAGPAVGMLVPLKVQSLGLSGAWLASCEAGLAIGVFAGSFYLAKRIIERLGRYATRAASGLVLGLSLSLAGVAHSGYLLVAAFALCGLSNSTLLLVGLTHRTLARPRAFRSRMSGATMTLNQIASAAGPALAGVLLTHWSISSVYGAFGVMTALVASTILLVRGFQEFMSLDHEAVDGWYGRQFPAAFADEVA